MANICSSDQNHDASKVRTLVVDDYEPFRQFTVSTLQTRQELQVVGEASDGFEAVRKAEELKPDLIVLDIGLPKLNGIDASHRISKFAPGAKILFLSQINDAEVALALLGNGARGYVLKAHAQSDLLPAVDAILRGARFVSEALCGDAQPIASSPAMSSLPTQPQARNRVPS
jgi:DNA-binding NarL/FixJ family response regulator